MKIDGSFLERASDAIGDTNCGLTGSEIWRNFKYFSDRFQKDLKYTKATLVDEKGIKANNKRTAVLENLKCFTTEEQKEILPKLFSINTLRSQDKIQRLKNEFEVRFAPFNLAMKSLSNNIKSTDPKIQVFRKRIDDLFYASLHCITFDEMNNVGNSGRLLCRDLGSFLYSETDSKEEGISKDDYSEIIASWINNKLKGKDNSDFRGLVEKLKICLNALTHTTHPTSHKAKLCALYVAALFDTIQILREN